MRCQIYKDIQMDTARKTVAYKAVPDMILEAFAGPAPETDTLTAIRQLPEDQGAIIALKYYLKFNYRQIGELLNVPVATIHRRHVAALASLREAL